MSKKDKLRGIAEETCAVIGDGGYKHHREYVELHLDSCMHDTEVYDDYGGINGHKTRFELMSCTTLEAAKQFSWDYEQKYVPGVYGTGTRMTVLNFASAKNPGGGFLRGTQAQEESLARASALYASLSRRVCNELFYQPHKKAKDPMYSDTIIWTPNCPVFREEDGSFLPRPYYINVITAAAPNLKAIQDKAGGEVSPMVQLACNNAIHTRVNKILDICVHHNARHLILGAWGCGVFGNDPEDVASAFHYRLVKTDKFKKAFDLVVFAIPEEEDHPNYKAFSKRFGDL